MRRFILLLLACLFLALPAWATVDLNAATQAELETLPGIGPAKAAAILEWRNAHGGFSDPAQLDDVPGIGPATLSRLLPLVSVAGAPGSTPASVERAAATAPSGSLGLAIEAASPQASQPQATGSSPAGSSSAGRIDINSASASELMSLPGIGASKAAAIVADRDQNGPFASCADLQRVTGIGAATVEKLEHMCVAR